MRSRRGPLPFFLAVALGASIPTSSHAQVSPREYAARRDALATGIDSGVVIAFGGRTPVADFGPFAQLPAFRYLTGYEYADAALVMVVRGGQGTGMLFVHRTAPLRSLYYGIEPDSADIARDLGLPSRPVDQLAMVADSLAGHGFPFYPLRDFAAADFAALRTLSSAPRPEY